MTNAKFAVLVAVALFVSFVGIGGTQSSGVITLPAPPATIAGCTWPASPNSVTAGTMTCIYGTATAPGLAIAVNGGAFFAVPMTQSVGGVASFNGRTGNVTLTKGDVTGTGLAASVTVTAPTVTVSTPTATATLQ